MKFVKKFISHLTLVALLHVYLDVHYSFNIYLYIII